MTAWDREGEGDVPRPERRQTQRPGWLRRVIGGEKLSLSAWPREVDADPRVQAAISLGAAWVLKRTVRPQLGELDALRLDQMARLIGSIWRLWKRFPGRSKSLLWMDHEPLAHMHERQVFEALEIETVAVETPMLALEMSATRAYSVIISAMHHPSEPSAAFRLLDDLRARGITSPVIIYDAGGTADRADAQRRGALDVTASPQELLRLVNQGLLIALSRAED